MPDWDQDSPQLRRNLAQVLRSIKENASHRKVPTVEDARKWHEIIMRGLTVPDQNFVGTFRGEEGVEDVEVRIGRQSGVIAGQVANEPARCEQTLQRAVQHLDQLLPPGTQLNTDTMLAILDLCAWAHAEWVRIHPFANGNGRIARLLASSVAMRYGLPPFVRLRPRPMGDYCSASEQAMVGNWKPTAGVFHRMLNDFLKETPPPS
jgi:Fic family protein